MATIVIVIRDKILREGLAYLINNSEGCSCEAAFPDYKNLIDYFPTNSPDLILLDIDISFERAVKSIAEIKSRTKGVVVIALSDDDSSEKVYKTISAGADGFLINNISHDELLESLKEACDGGAPLSSSAAKRLVDYFHKNKNNFLEERDYSLSPREKQVVALLADGKNMNKVAKELFISIDTVRFHSKNIYRKMKVHNQAELVAKALREKII